MARKRLTQLFPFLLPLRQWQRKKCCYLKMRLDKNHYADTISDELLPNKIFETSALMVNQSSGYDIQYQYNKVHNLKLAGKAIIGAPTDLWQHRNILFSTWRRINRNLHAGKGGISNFR